MIGESSKYFKEKDFPININFGRTSVIDKIEDGKCEIHEAIEIKYFYEGRSTLLVGNETIVAEAGDIVVMNPYEFHATISCSEERGKYHLIMVGLDFFPSFSDGCIALRNMFFSEKKAFVHHIVDCKELQSLVIELVNEHVEQREAYKLRMRGIMIEILALLIRMGLTTSDTVTNEQRIRYHAAIEPALRKIRNEYSSALSLEALADECCVTKYYFCRIFKEAMGITPIQYLCDYRLNNADILLRNTDKSISDILADCGFSDESYFFRCYKKHFGDTPNARRAKHLKNS